VRPHHCHAIGCEKPVRPEMLMCVAHWALVYPATQKEVRQHYRPEQCRTRKPSRAWLLAATHARLEVARHEERPDAVKYLEDLIERLSARVG